jgi:hypothetical protein
LGDGVEVCIAEAQSGEDVTADVMLELMADRQVNPIPRMDGSIKPDRKGKLV